MSHSHLLVGLALTMTLAGGLGAGLHAEEAPGLNARQKGGTGAAGETSPDLATLVLGRQLAAWGLAERNALALVLAAGIVRDHPTTAANATLKAGGRDQEPDPLGAVDYLLEQAREFAVGRPEIGVLIDDVANGGASRGAVSGARVINDKVGPGMTDSWAVLFRGERLAEISVLGGGGDIDCYLYDEHDQLIANAADHRPTCSLSWEPLWTGEFQIKIENRSSHQVPYLILTN
jgi:hypothetical protein